jgi:hypothetical protein
MLCYNSYIMCPENANIAIIEDKSYLRTLMSRNLKVKGHNVVAEASTMTEALVLIPRFEELGVQVAIIDGSLGRHSEGEDGEIVSKTIKELAPQVTTLGWSNDFIKGADMSFGKDDIKKICETITKL